MSGFSRHEHERALVRITEHLRNAIGHLRAARHEASNFGILIEIPLEKPFVDAISACAHIYKTPEDSA